MAFIQVPPDSTGSKVETTQPDGTDMRQVINLGDNSSTAIARVETADPGPTDAGVVTRDVRGNGSLPVRVDPTGTTAQPVSGTVAVSNLPSTQAISAASLPLPSGAATAAKQPALGTAGSPSADVISVQGESGMTPFKVDGSAVTQPVSGTVAVSNLPGTQAISAASLPLPTGAALDATLTGGTQKSKIVDAGGTNVATVSAAGALKVDGSAVTQPVSIAATVNDNISQIGGNAVSVDAGNTNTGTQRVVQATGSAINTGQVSVGNTATQIIAANTNRIKLTIFNVSGAVAVYLGNSGVATGTGSIMPAIAGYPVIIRSSAAIYGIVASGSQLVSYIEEVK